jgi:hypothetical protein
VAKHERKEGKTNTRKIRERERERKMDMKKLAKEQKGKH